MAADSNRYEKNLKVLRENCVQLALERRLTSSHHFAGNVVIAHKLRAYMLRDKLAQQQA